MRSNLHGQSQHLNCIGTINITWSTTKSQRCRARCLPSCPILLGGQGRASFSPLRNRLVDWIRYIRRQRDTPSVAKKIWKHFMDLSWLTPNSPSQTSVVLLGARQCWSHWYAAQTKWSSITALMIQNTHVCTCVRCKTGVHFPLFWVCRSLVKPRWPVTTISLCTTFVIISKCFMLLAIYLLEFEGLFPVEHLKLTVKVMTLWPIPMLPHKLKMWLLMSNFNQWLFTETPLLEGDAWWTEEKDLQCPQ